MDERVDMDFRIPVEHRWWNLLASDVELLRRCQSKRSRRRPILWEIRGDTQTIRFSIFH